MIPHECFPSLLKIPAEDLDRCRESVSLPSWQLLAGCKILITGGTGFIGKWLLATLLDANRTYSLGCDITVLSRDPEAFLRAWPSLNGLIRWISGDIRDFEFGTARFDVIVHAATDVVAQSSPEDLFSVCVDGTRRVLACARACGASRVLFLSSGAVYGSLPPGMTHVPESYLGAPDVLLPGAAYGEGKRVSEWLLSQASGVDLEVKIARVFAAVGPHLPPDKHFAVGNFVRDALIEKEILIQGDGLPHRSYLYAADMAAWLWLVLLRGKAARAYNVGSDESLSILALAHRVAALIGTGAGVRVLRPAVAGQIASHYVPDTRRARSELALPSTLGLDESLTRTAAWYRSYGQLQPL